MSIVEQTGLSLEWKREVLTLSVVKCGLHPYLLLIILMHANNKRRRSACTSVQSDQRLCVSLPGKYSCQAFQYSGKSETPKTRFLATGPRFPCLSLQLFTFFQLMDG